MIRLYLFKEEQSGFTLIELIVVVAILAVLMTIMIPKVTKALKDAKERTDDANIHILKNTLEHYFIDRGEYPGNLEVLEKEGYINDVPKKTDGTDFNYIISNDKQSYTLESSE